MIPPRGAYRLAILAVGLALWICAGLKRDHTPDESQSHVQNGGRPDSAAARLAAGRIRARGSDLDQAPPGSPFLLCPTTALQFKPLRAVAEAGREREPSPSLEQKKCLWIEREYKISNELTDASLPQMLSHSREETA